MSDSAAYILRSCLPGEPNVGIWFLYQSQSGQSVRLDVDLIEWVASPSIVGGGPTRLSAGPYRYTREFEGEVFASNQPEPQDWYLIPSNDDNTYLIAVDPKGLLVWTAEESKAPIRIAKFTGGPNQLFKFVPVLNPGE